MNCPVCKNIALAKISLEPHLPSHPCGQCHGQWVRGEHYFQWLDQQAPSGPIRTTPPLPHDTTRAKICPECGHFLTRYRVGHGVDFSIDRCSTCGGLWLDANEWETLKSHNLHTAVHQVFSAAWQADLHHQDQQRRTDELLTAHLGPDAYEELKRMKLWLDSHPRRAELYAYLLNQQAPTG